MKQRAIFFDRDGIVNRRLVDDYVKTIDEFIFNDYFFELFELTNRLGFISILVTNQQCVGKGIITESRLSEIHDFMQERLIQGVKRSFDAIYFCPDLVNTGSKYRKPETGMFIDAINKFNVEPSSSWTIGDSISDVEAGKKVGTQTILVGDFIKIDDADYIFPSLEEVLYFFRTYNK